MSWTSPFTVAITILPLVLPCSLLASINGSRYATACFMTRADLTTCGRNIFPSPNRSPTTFIPSISGPSITSIGRVACWRASSVSCSINSVMPLTSEYSRRLFTSHERHSACWALAVSSVLLPRYFSASSSKRSVPSSRRLRITSSTASRSSAGRSS